MVSPPSWSASLCRVIGGVEQRGAGKGPAAATMSRRTVACSFRGTPYTPGVRVGPLDSVRLLPVAAPFLLVYSYCPCGRLHDRAILPMSVLGCQPESESPCPPVTPCERKESGRDDLSPWDRTRSNAQGGGGGGATVPLPLASDLIEKTRTPMASIPPP
jgi:hypothetical protein